jgi:hypothetical protein
MKILLINNNISSSSRTNKWSLAFGSLLYTDLNATFLVCLFKKETFTCPDRTVQIFPFSNQERVSRSSTQLAEMFDVVDRPCQLRLFLRSVIVHVTALVTVRIGTLTDLHLGWVPPDFHFT